VAVWIGGDNKDYKLSKEKLEEICAHLAALTRKYGTGLVVAMSTHDDNERTKLIAERLAETPCHVWDGSGSNPFVGFIALADHIIITLDSETEISEACTTGKPIHVIPLDGGSAASRRFFRDLLEYGAIRTFDRELTTWSYEPLFETQRVGKLIREMIEDRPPLAQSVQRH
jgi:hypothetical protein